MSNNWAQERNAELSAASNKLAENGTIGKLEIVDNANPMMGTKRDSTNHLILSHRAKMDRFLTGINHMILEPHQEAGKARLQIIVINMTWTSINLREILCPIPHQL